MINARIDTIAREHGWIPDTMDHYVDVTYSHGNYTIELRFNAAGAVVYARRRHSLTTCEVLYSNDIGKRETVEYWLTVPVARSFTVTWTSRHDGDTRTVLAQPGTTPDNAVLMVARGYSDTVDSDCGLLIFTATDTVSQAVTIVAVSDTVPPRVVSTREVDNSPAPLAAGDHVADTRNPYRVVTGVVIETRGTMYRDTMVNVFWDHLGYSIWELPVTLTLVNKNGHGN